MGNSASKSDGAEPSAQSNKFDCSKMTCGGCTQGQDPANPKPDCKAVFSCPADGECRTRKECCAPTCCTAAQKPHVPAAKSTPPPTPPPSTIVGRESAVPGAPHAPQQAAHQHPPVPAHQQPHAPAHQQPHAPGHQQPHAPGHQGYQQAYYVPQSGSHESPAFYITSKDPHSNQPPHQPTPTQQILPHPTKTQELPAQPPKQASPQPPQQRTITLPPPMMLSGATPVRGPAPIAPQHQHLYTNSTSPPIAQAPPPKRQPGCGSMQNVCSPSLCPPFKGKPQTVTGTDRQAVPYGPGPGPHTMATPPGGYTNHQESRPDTIPPNAPNVESPPATGKIFSKQIYPPILQNYQSVPSGAGANPAAHGNGQPQMSAPSAAAGQVIHSIPQTTGSRPGFGDAL